MCKPRTGQLTGHRGSVLVRLIPAPGALASSQPLCPRRPLVMATFDAISKDNYLTPDLSKDMVFIETDHLTKTPARVSLQRTQAPAIATTWFYMRKMQRMELIKN
uniref:Uncharacterized protein n=1 Tax=Capra hircus TaxID=9925 RepID=A0A8C2RTL1_CAPHI